MSPVKKNRKTRKRNKEAKFPFSSIMFSFIVIASVIVTNESRLSYENIKTSRRAESYSFNELAGITSREKSLSYDSLLMKFQNLWFNIGNVSPLGDQN